MSSSNSPSDTPAGASDSESCPFEFVERLFGLRCPWREVPQCTYVHKRGGSICGVALPEEAWTAAEQTLGKMAPGGKMEMLLQQPRSFHLVELARATHCEGHRRFVADTVRRWLDLFHPLPPPPGSPVTEDSSMMDVARTWEDLLVPVHAEHTPDYTELVDMNMKMQLHVTQLNGAITHDLFESLEVTKKRFNEAEESRAATNKALAQERLLSQVLEQKLSEAQASLAASNGNVQQFRTEVTLLNNRLESMRLDSNGRHHVVVQAPPPGQPQYANHGPAGPSQQQSQAAAAQSAVASLQKLLKQRDKEIRRVEDQDEKIAELNSTVNTLLN
ncbi:hypothetical protein B0T24DRAFT_594796 [Lasiosphaeria ovina]|uniref:Uncharacterized protein n=1 Tax=Lasiosphaeria ovina TaxID=92902 RepID=A0AAE0K6S3_9PEZI|nr:hypothetical protein B0T24DRAFT_594796 [Lasiosphaeria ovina]